MFCMTRLGLYSWSIIYGSWCFAGLERYFPECTFVHFLQTGQVLSVHLVQVQCTLWSIGVHRSSLKGGYCQKIILSLVPLLWLWFHCSLYRVIFYTEPMSHKLPSVCILHCGQNLFCPTVAWWTPLGQSTPEGDEKAVASVSQPPVNFRDASGQKCNPDMIFVKKIIQAYFLSFRNLPEEKY